VYLLCSMLDGPGHPCVSLLAGSVNIHWSWEYLF